MNKNQGLAHSLLLCAFLSLSSTSVHAQITPDNTLGTETSKLTPNVLINGASADLINGGAQRGNNLFHSFNEFNIKDGQGVYFANPSGVVNILTRVTGSNASNILGTLGVDGAANLFLINPNGILFGKNASLDVRGSFVGTTANGLQFGNQGNFSATNPNSPGLLTINPSALFFNQINPNAAIQNNSVAPNSSKDPAGFGAVGLRVPDGKSLLLVGGNVSMDGGQLNVYGGRIELGGVLEPGNINLLFDKTNLTLGFPAQVARASVSLTNQAKIDVEGAGGGDIVVNAENIYILGGSRLTAGIGQGLGTPETVAGDITLNATREVKVADSRSGIRNLVGLGSKGNGGNITIDAGSLNLQDGAQLVASTSGKGSAGNVTVNAKNSIGLTGQPTGILSTVEAGGVGKGSNININSATLSLTDGAQLLTSTRRASDTQAAGKGDAGNVNVKVTGTVNIAGQKNGFSSGIRSNVGTGTEGLGGNITIDADSLNLRDGAQLSASTSGIGNAGNVTVNAKNSIFLIGQPTGIFSAVEAGGVGKGGNININGAALSLTDGTQLLTITRRASDTQAAGKGDAGNVNVKVTGTVDIAGQKNGFLSAIGSFVHTGTEGSGGNITIDASSLYLRDGAILEASTSGKGSAGNVTVNAKNSIGLTDSSILSTVEAGGMGKGGNININGATLSLTDGAQLLTITRRASDTQVAGKGDAGNVNVKVTGTVDIAGQKNGFSSGIYSLVETGTEGSGGNITIDAGSLNLQDGAILEASTSGKGSAGNVTVTAIDSIGLIGNSNILSTVEAGGVGKGGNININGATLSLTDGAQLVTITRGASDTQAPGKGDAGNVNVKVKGTVDITGQKNGFPSGIYSLVDTGTEGSGGNIAIDAGSLYLRDGARLVASTFGKGSAGTIKINASDFITISSQNFSLNSGLYVNSQSTTGNAGDIIATSSKITLDNQGTINAESASGNGGNINLNSDLLLLRRSSQISTNAGNKQQGGDGGNININSKYIVAVPSENSDITANAFTGKGGNVFIRTQGIFGIESRALESPLTSDITASSDRGVQGQVSITQPEVQPAQGLIELPEEVVDATRRVAQICPREPGAKPLGEFTITGRGSLPPSPLEALPGTNNTANLATLDGNSNGNVSNVVPHKTQSTIIEAQGWVKNSDGSMELVAMALLTTPSARTTVPTCPSISSQY